MCYSRLGILLFQTLLVVLTYVEANFVYLKCTHTYDGRNKFLLIWFIAWKFWVSIIVVLNYILRSVSVNLFWFFRSAFWSKLNNRQCMFAFLLWLIVRTSVWYAIFVLFPLLELVFNMHLIWWNLTVFYMEGPHWRCLCASKVLIL